MTSPTATDLQAIVQAVARNCAISDARHARDHSLCIYLLRMREHYRWQQALPLTQKLEISDVGDWITQTEDYWEDLEQLDYQPIPVADQWVDPFDHETINSVLQPAGHVYAAGIGRFGQPHFFVGQLLSTETRDGVCYRDSGPELIRDLLPQPAMAQGNSVFLRQDCIRRYIWQQVEEWQLNPVDGPLARVVRSLQLHTSLALEDNLIGATQTLRPVFLLHETGEIKASHLLGENYQKKIHEVCGSKAELYARAIKDMVADTQCTLPALVAESVSLRYDYWLASLGGIRKDMLEKTGWLSLLLGATARDQLERSLIALQNMWLDIAEHFTALPGQQLGNDTVDTTMNSLLQQVRERHTHPTC